MYMPVRYIYLWPIVHRIILNMYREFVLFTPLASAIALVYNAMVKLYKLF